MKPKIILYLFIIITLISACDEEDSARLDNSDIPLIYQVWSDEELFYEYTYTKANLISEEKSKLHYTKHNYNDKNQVISTDFYMDPAMYSSYWDEVQNAQNRNEWVSPENTEKESSRHYKYDNKGFLIKSNDHTGYAIYSYDKNNRINKMSHYHDDEISGYIEYQYDRHDNLIKRSHYYVLETGEIQLATTTEYEFDNKHNPYQTFHSLMLPGRNTNRNNIIKEIYTLYFDVDSSIDKIQITEYKYEYDIKGFPIRKNESVEFVYQ